MRLRSIVAGVLSAILVTAVMAGGDAELKKPPEGWEFFVQKNRAYGILIPKKGRQLFEKEGNDKVKNFSLRYSGLECDIKDDVTVRVLALRFPPLPKGELLDTRTVLELFRDSYLKSFPGKLKDKETEVGKAKWPGTEYRIELDDGKQARLRVYLLRSKATIAYQVSVTGTQAQVDGKVASRILNSFRPAGTLKDIVGEYKKKK